MEFGKLKKSWFQRYQVLLLKDNSFSPKIKIYLTKIQILLVLLLSFFASIGIGYGLSEWVRYYWKRPKSKEYLLAQKLKHLEKAIAEQETLIYYLQQGGMPKLSADSTSSVLEEAPRQHVSVATKNTTNTVEFSSASWDKLSPLLPPVRGILLREVSLPNRHFGIDIAAKRGELIRSATEGMVVFSEFSYETGYVLAIQHPSGLLSIYKHNRRLLKHLGDFVKKGEPIAIIGNSGEYSTGPHLHFELWYKGIFLNPKTFFLY